jgi:hypothetical protein
MLTKVLYLIIGMETIDLIEQALFDLRGNHFINGIV